MYSTIDFVFSALSLCIDAVQSMLYPFVWQHTIVPVLPQSMTEIASAPTPFILGLLSKNVEDWKSIYPDQVFIITWEIVDLFF